MANRFYTLMVVPEEGRAVRKWLIPSWVIRGAGLLLFVGLALTAIMAMDYLYLSGRVGENRDLQVENRRLRQKVQVYRSRIANIEKTLDRIEVFSNRLKVITNIDQEQSDLVDRIKQQYEEKETAEKKEEEAKKRGAYLDSLHDLHPEDPEREYLIEDYDTIVAQLRILETQALENEIAMNDTYELLIDQRSFLAALPNRKPAVGVFTSGFGTRKHPITGRVRMHEGLDVANRIGTPVVATADGVIRYANYRGSFGYLVVIDHGYGLETWYGHCNRLLVQAGQSVRRGDRIALLGNSGGSTGPHVHYEVRVYGIPVDPRTYLL